MFPGHGFRGALGILLHLGKNLGWLCLIQPMYLAGGEFVYRTHDFDLFLLDQLANGGTV